MPVDDAVAGERPADAARERCRHARPRSNSASCSPASPTTWPALLAQLNATRRNNRLYVRLIASSTGTVVGGETLPALPASVRSILDEDKTVHVAPRSRGRVVGAWEQRLDRAVRGSRELIADALTAR